MRTLGILVLTGLALGWSGFAAFADPALALKNDRSLYAQQPTVKLSRTSTAPTMRTVDAARAKFGGLKQSTSRTGVATEKKANLR